MKRATFPGGVAIFGAGKVGVALHRGLRAAGVKSELRAARRGLPERPYRAALLVLAVRDGALAGLSRQLRERGLVGPSTAVVHVAGALGSAALDELRGVSAGVAQMHPMIAFASLDFCPTLAGGHAHVEGDAEAVKRARRLCGVLGLKPRTFPGLDAVGYHAAAGLVANGATALAAAGAALLSRSGVPEATIPRLLGPLLRSVAENVEALGLPGALTGPVRRGDAGAVERHLATILRLTPGLERLYLEMARAQLPMARQLGDAPPEAFDRVAEGLAR